MSTIQTLTTQALNHAAAYGASIAALRKACAKLDRDAARVEILPTGAAFYGVPVIDGERKAAGTKVLDKTAKNFESARKALSRLLADIYGSDKPKAEAKAMRVAKDLRAAAEAYLANFDDVAEAIKVLRAVAK